MFKKMKRYFLLLALIFIFSQAISGQNYTIVIANLYECECLCPEADILRKALQTKIDDASKKYQSLVEEFEAKYKVYQEYASQWDSNYKNDYENLLSGLQEQIINHSDISKKDIQSENDHGLKEIKDYVQNVARQIAQSYGCSFVIDTADLFYYNNNSSQIIDITDELRLKLNIAEDRTLEGLRLELIAHQS